VQLIAQVSGCRPQDAARNCAQKTENAFSFIQIVDELQFHLLSFPATSVPELIALKEVARTLGNWHYFPPA
jgi:hypothetical protein